MKSAVIYYTHFGNTGYVAYKFYDALRAKGEADIFEIEYREPTMAKHNLLKRIFYRVMPLLIDLEPIPHELKAYDVICLGIPVRMGRPSPPVIKYLSMCKDLDNKKIVCFYLFGVEASLKRCSRFMESILRRKAPHSTIIHAHIPWPELYNNIFLSKVVNETLDKLQNPGA